jgi:predicted AlkP superfamily pyrophosphatase or phosphodiesterase
MKKTVVMNVVGLCHNILGENTPRLNDFIKRFGQFTVRPGFPAVTASAQSTYLTGLTAAGHGVVGNGWYFKDMAQVWLWRQANALVGGEKIWDAAKRENPSFTCANLFWWFNMYSTVDYSVTPRPIYRADGLKLPDIYTEPFFLGEELQSELGPFPLFQFWGPGADHRSTQWIAQAARAVFKRYCPTMTFVYLPHLDYDLQRFGPNDKRIGKAVRRIDEICGNLIDFFEERKLRVVLLSEYGINPVSGAVPINRILREQGWIRVRKECQQEILDAGASPAFAVADHQVAHVYIQKPGQIDVIRAHLESIPGIETVWDSRQQQNHGIAHERSGDLVLTSTMDRWFSYPYWLDDEVAPDFARTVDIHRKPGYDPVELWLDPKIRFPRLHIARRLLQKKLGFRYLMDVISLDTSLVRGSHGRVDVPREYMPIFLTNTPELVQPEIHFSAENFIEPTHVKSLLMSHVFGLKSSREEHQNASRRVAVSDFV